MIIKNNMKMSHEIIQFLFKTFFVKKNNHINQINNIR